MNFVNSQTPQDERRQYGRSRLIIDVFFNGEDVTGVAGTKDISPGGLYMNTKTEIPEGSLLTLRVPVGGARHRLQRRGHLQQPRSRRRREVPGAVGRRPRVPRKGAGGRGR